jgi:hypothetical protein
MCEGRLLCCWACVVAAQQGQSRRRQQGWRYIARINEKRFVYYRCGGEPGQGMVKNITCPEGHTKKMMDSRHRAMKEDGQAGRKKNGGRVGGRKKDGGRVGRREGDWVELSWTHGQQRRIILFITARLEILPVLLVLDVLSNRHCWTVLVRYRWYRVAPLSTRRLAIA